MFNFFFWTWLLLNTIPAPPGSFKKSRPQRPAAAPIIKRGDIVYVTVHGNYVKVKAVATAQNAGVLGATIMVLPHGGHKIIAAIITGPHDVQVAL